MISSHVALVGALASLQAVSAQSFDGGRGGVLQRIENKNEIGNACHSPLGTYVLSKPGSPKIPPCIAEQGISSTCEKLTKALTMTPGLEETKVAFKAYQQCLVGPGSSFRRDVMACMDCKLQHNIFSPEQHQWWVSKTTQGLDAFTKDPEPTTHTWEYTARAINGDWNSLIVLPKPRADAEVKVKSIADYYLDMPEVQGLGRFTLNNRTYPEAALRDEGLLPEKPIQRADPVGKLFEVKMEPVPAPADAQTQSTTQLATLPTTLVRMVSTDGLSTTTGSPTTASGVSTKSGSVSGSDSGFKCSNSGFKRPGFNHTGTGSPLPGSTSVSGAGKAASLSAHVLVQSVYQADEIIVNFEGSLRFSLASVATQMHTIASAEIRLMLEIEATRLGLPDISDCEACKLPISLNSTERSEAVINKPAGPVGQQISSLLSDKSLPAQVIQEKIQEVLNDAVTDASASVGAATTVYAGPSQQQVATDETEIQGSVAHKQATAVEVEAPKDSVAQKQAAMVEAQGSTADAQAAAVEVEALEGGSFIHEQAATHETQGSVAHKQATAVKVEAPKDSVAHKQAAMVEAQGSTADAQAAAVEVEVEAPQGGSFTHKQTIVDETETRGSVEHKAAFIENLGSAADAQAAEVETKTQGSVGHQQAAEGSFTHKQAVANETESRGPVDHKAAFIGIKGSASEAQAAEVQAETHGSVGQNHTAAGSFRLQAQAQAQAQALDQALAQVEAKTRIIEQLKVRVQHLEAKAQAAPCVC